MKPLSLVSVLTFGVVGALVGAAVNAMLLASGQFPLLLTPFLGALGLVVAVILLILGRSVKALRDGEETSLSYVSALRIVLFARASALVSAGFTGLCAGIILTDLPRIEGSAVQESALWAGVAAAGFILWMLAGILVEKWGQRRDDDQPRPQSNSAA